MPHFIRPTLVALLATVLFGLPLTSAAMDDQTYERLEAQAEEIIQGIDQEAKAHAPKAGPVIREESLIVMNMPFVAVLSALLDGFKNLHETGETNGDWDPETRQIVESFIAGRPLENSQALQPKYAYVLFPKERIRMGEYGDIYVIFKDHVKARSTWTPFDSFRLQDHIDSGEGRKQALVTGDLNTFQFAKSPPKKKWAYTEAQIWGPLDIRDVAEIILPEKFSPTGYGAFDRYLDPYARLMLEKLISLKVPVSLLGRSDSVSQAILKRRQYPVGEWPKKLRLISAKEEMESTGSEIGMHPELKAESDTQRLKNYVLPFLDCPDYLRLR